MSQITKRIFNFDLLQNYSKEHNLVLLKDYTNVPLKNTSKIEYICETEGCNNELNKNFLTVLKITGPFCNNCKEPEKLIKRKESNMKKFGVEHHNQLESFKLKKMISTVFTYDFLINYFKEHELVLVSDYSIKNVNINSKIKGICKTKDCNNHFEKVFRSLCKYNCYYCKNCQSKVASEKRKNTCLEKYGVEHISQDLGSQEKTKKTNLEKYGFESPAQNKDVQDKMKATNMKKYGVDNALKCKEIYNKIKVTNLKKYGVECTLQVEDVKSKIKETNLIKYGVCYPMQNEDIKEKSKITSNKNWGYSYAHQNPEFSEKCSKQSFKFKDYILPSGKIIKIQGYENYALDELLKVQNISEDLIITGVQNVPEIWYDDENEKKHRHYVDIFIPSQNKCIEIKSTWTVAKKKDSVFLKQTAGKLLGYEYEIWVYNEKGNIVIKHL